MAKRAEKKKKKEDDTTFVICQPVEPGFTPVAGAMERPCSKCQRPVWLSLATEAAVAGLKPNLICIPCTRTLDPDEVDQDWQAPTPAQIDELRSVLTPDQLRRLHDTIPSGSPARRRRMGQAILKDLIQRRRRIN